MPVLSSQRYETNGLRIFSCRIPVISVMSRLATRRVSIPGLPRAVNRIIRRCNSVSNRRPRRPKISTPVQTRAHRLQTPEGRALYALRKQTQEPVFSIIKSILGFRQFSLRGLEKVRGKLEPRDHGLEYQAFVRARSHPRLTGPAGLGNADTAIKAHRLCQVVARPRLKPAPPTEAVILVLQCDEIRLSITLCCPRWPKTQTIGAVKPCRGCLRLLLAA